MRLLLVCALLSVLVPSYGFMRPTRLYKWHKALDLCCNYASAENRVTEDEGTSIEDGDSKGEVIDLSDDVDDVDRTAPRYVEKSDEEDEDNDDEVKPTEKSVTVEEENSAEEDDTKTTVEDDEDASSTTRSSTASLASSLNGPRSLLSFHGTFLRARNSDRDAVRVDLAWKRNVCERWNIAEVDGKVAIKSFCKPGGFLKANVTGAVDVSDRPVDDALWTPYKNEGGTWSLKSVYGKWLSARRDGNVKTMERCDSWEYFWIESYP